MTAAVELRASTTSAAATQALASELAPILVNGDLLVLVGDLGAGKTAFTQGLCAALGVTGRVTSPTFTLANRYEGRMVVNHLDVYRIMDLAEAQDLALTELLEEGVTVIEWGDRIAPALPDDRLEIRITFGAGDDDRVLELRSLGDRWDTRREALTGALRPWATS